MASEQRGKNGGGAAALYRLLPSLNDLLLEPKFQTLIEAHSRNAVVRAGRDTLAVIKQEISDGRYTEATLTTRLESVADRVGEELDKVSRFSLRRVINATGVILHTNLGRAPLSQSAFDHIAEVARGYCNLELDLESGERSRRDVHAEELILRVLRSDVDTVMEGAREGERAAVVVNNCAAATFLALNSLAEGAEVIVSRGELVEIGGGFRIPEILAKSGAVLREVGTTNRTRVEDYERAVSPNTALLLRVHQSNFRIEGFTERPTLEELVSLGRKSGVAVFEDQGTGLLFELGSEETLLESSRRGVDLIAASGDKLLGGPQCGILIGRKDLIERIRKNPLLRTFRVDKLTYAALEATLMDHHSGRGDSIPIKRMLETPASEIERRCRAVADAVNPGALQAEVVPMMSVIGGGTAPGARLESFGLSVHHAGMKADALLRTLRSSRPAVIGRIADECVLLDLRTVEPELDAMLISLLRAFSAQGQR